MIVLDSNVISELMKTNPEPLVIAWLDAQHSKEIWTTSICVFEISFGLNILPDGKRKRALREAFDKALQVDLKGQVLDFDVLAAEHAGEISARVHAVGRPVEIRDIQIAAIVDANAATLATRNTKHFVDSQIALINPWDQ